MVDRFTGLAKGDKLLYHKKVGGEFDEWYLFGPHDKLLGDLWGLHGDCTNVFGTAGNLTGDVSNISGDISNIQGKIGNLKGDVSNMKGWIDHSKIGLVINKRSSET